MLVSPVQYHLLLLLQLLLVLLLLDLAYPAAWLLQHASELHLLLLTCLPCGPQAELSAVPWCEAQHALAAAVQTHCG
jgi:hypothetical protein